MPHHDDEHEAAADRTSWANPAMRQFREYSVGTCKCTQSARAIATQMADNLLTRDSCLWLGCMSMDGRERWVSHKLPACRSGTDDSSITICYRPRPTSVIDQSPWAVGATCISGSQCHIHMPYAGAHCTYGTRNMNMVRPMQWQWA